MINNISTLLSDEGNVLVSPVSIEFALRIAEKGARGNTLKQLKNVLGTDSKSEISLNTKAFHMANAIWLNKDMNFEIDPDIDESVNEIHFNREGLDKINAWVKKNTNGMIDSILDSIPEIALMYLINAVSFENEWEKCYDAWDTVDKNFKLKDGRKKKVPMMPSKEHIFLKDDNVKGFLKYYNDSEYAFVALLPDKNISADEYIRKLTWEKITSILSTAKLIPVKTIMPKFEYSYESDLAKKLKKMGITDAFDKNLADFSGFGKSLKENIYLDSVLHKTHIVVDEDGTKAAAVTSACFKYTCAPEPVEKYENVILDRPFVFMIIDCRSNIPIFIGKLEDPSIK